MCPEAVAGHRKGQRPLFCGSHEQENPVGSMSTKGGVPATNAVYGLIDLAAAINAQMPSDPDILLVFSDSQAPVAVLLGLT